MKLMDCVNAYRAVKGLSRKDVDFNTAFSLVKLERALKPHFTFFVEKELELAKEYAKLEDGKIVMGASGFVFSDPTKAEEYNRRHKELEEVTVDDMDKVKVRLSTITPEQLDALDDFVEFEVV